MFLTSSPALWYVQCLANGVYSQLSGRPVWCSQLLLLSPRDDVVSNCAVPSTVLTPAAFLQRHRFRYCRQNHTTSATQFTDATIHCTYITKTLYVVRAGGSAMGRRPNVVVGEFFHRGQKLDDNSNRYQHTCKKCGQHVRRGKSKARYPLTVSMQVRQRPYR
jgi:hypothetical protein